MLKFTLLGSYHLSRYQEDFANKLKACNVDVELKANTDIETAKSQFTDKNRRHFKVVKENYDETTIKLYLKIKF